MNATEAGPTIAIALENFAGRKAKEGKILSFIRSSDDSRGAIKRLEDQNRELLNRVEALENLKPR